MTEYSIIQALTESKKAKAKDVEKVKEDDLLEDEVFLYVCDECGAEFESDEVVDDEDAICPECGGHLSLEDEDEDETDEGFVKRVRNGQIQKVKTKKGYKFVDGKLVKMSAKERAARKKAGKKMGMKGLGHKGQANKKRLKSLKLRNRKGLNSSLEFNENIVMTMLNSVIADVTESMENAFDFEISRFESAVYNSDVDTLTLESVVAYSDGLEANATFVVENVSTGEMTISETNGVLDVKDLVISAKGSMDESFVTFDEMSYVMKQGNKIYSETFELV